ncbi:hypothetical protein V2J09_000840 [Rumex salicifolius]
MVLWEIAVTAAYFLGLKRTYRLALRIERRLIDPSHPKIRQFLHRRTRAVFDVALTVHRNIQDRDLEVGRNLGNWILRYLDKLKPSANISGSTLQKLPPPKNGSLTRSTTNSIQKNGVPRSNAGSSDQGSSDRHLFSTARNAWHRSFPTMTMMMHPSRITGTSSTTQFRHLSFYHQPELWG